MKKLSGRTRCLCLPLLVSVWVTAPARADVVSEWNEQVRSVSSRLERGLPERGRAQHVLCLGEQHGVTARVFAERS